VRVRWLAPQAVVIALFTLVACSTTHATPPSPTPVVGWRRGALSVPFEADHSAVVVTSGPPPRGVTGAQALRLAHDSVGDLAAIASAKVSCAECTAGVGNPLPVRPVSGRVTLAVPRGEITGPYRKLSNTPAWVVPIQPWIPMCPAEPITFTTLPSSASHLDLLIITGPGLANVIVYHGTGTGTCRQRTHPALAFDPPTGQGGDLGN
jgi:hypothetical protein